MTTNNNTPRGQLDLVGIVVEDMARSLAFYRQVGMDIPADADGQPHVQVTMAGGLRLAWDTLETIRSFAPEWHPPAHGYRMSLAFRLDSPAEVDALYNALVDKGYEGYKAPWDAFW